MPPFISPHFNLTVEIPLKAIIGVFRGLRYQYHGGTDRKAWQSLNLRKWALVTSLSWLIYGWKNILVAETIGESNE